MCALWCVESRKYCLWPQTAHTALSNDCSQAVLPLAQCLELLTAVNSWCSSRRPCYGEVGLRKRRSWFYEYTPLSHYIHMPCHSNLVGFFMLPFPRKLFSSFLHQKTSDWVTLFPSSLYLLKQEKAFLLSWNLQQHFFFQRLSNMYSKCVSLTIWSSEFLGLKELVREPNKLIHVYYFLMGNLYVCCPLWYIKHFRTNLLWLSLQPCNKRQVLLRLQNIK